MGHDWGADGTGSTGMTDLRTTSIELRLGWDERTEDGLCDRSFTKRLKVDDIWPDGPPEHIDAKTVQEAIFAVCYLTVQVPNPAYIPGMLALPGMEAPRMMIVTSVKL
jgi:hypothetical protein